MHQFSAKQRKHLVDEINITPLTDVFLVLLIIMIVVAPMVQSSRPEIVLPQIDEGAPAITKVKLTVEITRNGTYFIDGKQVEQEQLADTLREKGGQATEKEMVIRADRYTKSLDVMRVFDAARTAEYKGMTVAVETLASPRQKELDKQAVPEEAPPS